MADSITALPPGFVLDAPAGLPPGFVIDAPATGITPEVAATQPTEDPGFLDRVTQDLQARGDVGEEIAAAFQAGDQGVLESGFQLAGKVGAGGVLDVVGEALVSGLQGLSAITPDAIEDDVLQTATNTALDFLSTDAGRTALSALEGGAAAWTSFKDENPRAARNIESAANIGFLVAPVKGKPKAPADPTIIGRAAEEVAGKAAEQTARQKTAFVDDLVMPKQTAKVRTEQVGRTTEAGPFRTKTPELSAGEQAMAQEVGRIKGVGGAKTIQGNYNVINKEVGTEAQKLTNLLAKNDVAIPKREFAAELERAVVRLGENPLLVGDAAKTASKVVDKMKQIVAKNPGTASGLLKSRKQLDAWIKTQKPKVFDSNQESALSLAVREIRQSTNNFIDERAVNVAVKDSLKKQSTLFRAMENIAPKAADEANNSILRAWQSANEVLGLRGGFNQTLAAMFGLGGLGASATFAPIFTAMAGTGVVTYAAGKAAMSPGAKKGLSKLLGAVDRSIRASKDKDVVSQLRIDRAAIAEVLKQSNE